MRGFTLLEVIIALSILSVGVAGSVALINKTISASSAVRNQMVAWYLAQEGMEVVHNIRNTNWIEDVSWDDGLAAGNYCVNASSTSVTALGNPCTGGNRNLYFLGSSYTHDSDGAATDFSRYLEIASTTDAGGVSYKLVKSIVTWRNRTVSAEERLYDWK